EIDDVLGAPVQLGMSLLPAETLGLGHGDPRDSDFVQRLLHFVELERLDDGLDLFHWSPAQVWSGRANAGRLSPSPDTVLQESCQGAVAGGRQSRLAAKGRNRNDPRGSAAARDAILHARDSR